MPGQSLTLFAARLRREDRVWAVDRESGSVVTLPLLQYTMIVGTKEASIYTFKDTAAKAYAEQARMLDEIAGRN